MVDTESHGLLRDPDTGSELIVIGKRGHEIVVKHRPRVPVLDVPGREGDEVQHLGRKSRVFKIMRGIFDGTATGPLKVNPLLVGGITESPSESVSFGTETVTDALAEGAAFGGMSLAEGLSEGVLLVVT